LTARVKKMTTFPLTSTSVGAPNAASATGAMSVSNVTAKRW
jgi:hypothetical protein